MPVLSIAGAGTDIGKTYVAAALLRALKKRGVPIDALKPVASGIDEADYAGSDPAILLEALGREVTADAIDHIAPFRFAAPLSPPLAAKREGRALSFDVVRDLCRSRAAAAGEALLLVETAGGVMSPLDDTHTMLDLMAALGGPAVLVSGSYLGAISHTLTALACLRSRGLPVIAMAISESPGEAPFDETVAALAGLADRTPVIMFRRDAAPDAPAADLAERVARIVLT